MNKWIVTSASAIGPGHIASNIPCQDSSCALLSDNGEWTALVVSDGAGTAKYSDKSSSLVSKSFAKALIELSNEIEHRAPGAWINDFVIEHIITTRKELRNLAGTDSLNDFHCTLVACLLGSSGGFLIHIGDGAIFGGGSKILDKNKTSLSHSAVISLPENREYSNETFFITEGDWIKHLRITSVSPVDWIVLGTDGGTTLAMIGDKEPKPGFIVPLLNTLTKDVDDSSRMNKLKAILNDIQADKLTSDDKTLCIAYRAKLATISTEFVMDGMDVKSDIAISVNTEEKEEGDTLPTIKTNTTKASVNPVTPTKFRWEILLVIAIGIIAALCGLILIYLAVQFIPKFYHLMFNAIGYLKNFWHG